MKYFFFVILILLSLHETSWSQDISNCDDRQMNEYAVQLENLGYKLVSDIRYEVVYYKYGSSYYWKTVHAKKMSNSSGQLAIANCKGIHGNLVSKQLIAGQWNYCNIRDSFGKCVSSNSGSGNGIFELAVLDLSVDPIGGAIYVDLDGEFKLYEKGRDCSWSDTFAFGRACKKIKFVKGRYALEPTIQAQKTLLQFAKGSLTAVKFAFASSDGDDFAFSTPSAPSETFAIRVLDLNNLTGLNVLPKKKLVRGVDFVDNLTIINESSFELVIKSNVTPLTILRAKNGLQYDKYTFKISSSALLEINYPGGKEEIEIIE